MITAKEAEALTTDARKKIAEQFELEHPEVLARIEKMIRDNPGSRSEMYYENSGELAVPTVELGVALMCLGYGVRAAIPGVKVSGMHIRWCRGSWDVDSNGFTWM